MQSFPYILSSFPRIEKRKQKRPVRLLRFVLHSLRSARHKFDIFTTRWNKIAEKSTSTGNTNAHIYRIAYIFISPEIISIFIARHAAGRTLAFSELSPLPFAIFPRFSDFRNRNRTMRTRGRRLIAISMFYRDWNALPQYFEDKFRFSPEKYSSHDRSVSQNSCTGRTASSSTTHLSRSLKILDFVVGNVLFLWKRVRLQCW